MFHSTTILAVRHRDKAVLAGDGQVTFGQTVVKQGARKIRRHARGAAPASISERASAIDGRRGKPSIRKVSSS